ncbi:MAG: glycosyltransferase family 25 protein [Chitinophagaceae bacterium]|nr:glycosyltransferase family 25 protein [Chitinophagaceae bacterium]
MPPTVQDINDLLQQYFDKVLVLTVPRFKDRQEKITQRLAGITFEFFYGVDKNELDTDFISLNYIYDKKLSLSVRQQFKEMNTGEIACALSHRKIYQAILDNNWQRVLILEDDVIPDLNTLPLLFDAVKELPPSWELFYLGYLKNEKITTGSLIKQAWYKILRFLGLSNLSYQQISNLAPKPFSHSLMKAGFHDCTHAYAVSNAGAKKLLNASTPVRHRADNLLSALVLSNTIEAYASRSFLFNQEIFVNQSDQSHVREPQKLSVS